MNQLIFQGKIGRPVTLLQPNSFTEDFKRVCFKHFKECKYYYGRTYSKQKYETKMAGVNKI